jgi:hypothetical protein
LLFAAWLQGWLDGIFVPVTMELSLGNLNVEIIPPPVPPTKMPPFEQQQP